VNLPLAIARRLLADRVKSRALSIKTENLLFFGDENIRAAQG
jgi:hypothetical protein